MASRKPIPIKRRIQIFLAQDGKCFDCGAAMKPAQWQVDHRQALIHGGDDAEDNLRAVCADCHKRKTARDVSERSRGDRIAAGGKVKRSRPMPGTKASGIRKRMNGAVERW